MSDEEFFKADHRVRYLKEFAKLRVDSWAAESVIRRDTLLGLIAYEAIAAYNNKHGPVDSELVQ